MTDTLNAEDVERGLAETRERLTRGDEQERRIARRLVRLRERWPGLAGSLSSLRPCASSVRTVGVRPDGELPFSVDWVSALVDDDLDFVLAHEAMHLERGTHRRTGPGAPPWLVQAMNIAHDAVINASLADAMGRPPPASGVSLPGAMGRLPEVLALELATSGKRTEGEDYDVLGDHQPLLDPALSDSGAIDFDPHAFDALSHLQGADGYCDVSIAVGEYASFKLVQEMRAKRPDAVAWGRPDGVFRPKGDPPTSAVEEAVAQAIFASSTTQERTWARPSRRTATAGEPRRGQRQRGRELTVLLDTSGSMLPWLQEALGAVRAIAETFDVEHVRLVQCDGIVTRDEALAVPADLAETIIAGTPNPELFVVRTPCINCGKRHAWVIGDALPTRLDEGLRHLESEGVASAVVLTDGLVHAGPATEIDLTWLVFGQGFGFVPPSGRCVSLGVRTRGHK